jgi:protein SCO1
MLRKITLCAAALLPAASPAARPAAAHTSHQSSGGAALPEATPAGGDFALTDQDGRRFELKQLRGKVVLLYFGYATCAEACPAMLTKVSSVYRLLGGSKGRVAFLLVSVDPRRDTPQKLKSYLGYFRVPATGLTGSREEIDRVVARYGARYEIEESDSALGYHVSHTTDLFVVDRAGKLRRRFRHDERAAEIAAGIKELL